MNDWEPGIASRGQSSPRERDQSHTAVKSMTRTATERGPLARAALRAAALVGLATLADCLAWLGWQRAKHLGPDGYLHGPYDPWQIAGFIVVLGVIVVAAASRGHAKVAVVTTTLVVTLFFSVQGATDPRSDGLWPIGAVLVAVGTACAASLTVAPVLLWRRVRPRSVTALQEGRTPP